MASLFVYKMQVIQLIPDKWIDKINEIIVKFLWKEKREKIALKTLQINKEDGGLGLIDLQTKHKSLLLSWMLECKNNALIANLANSALGVSHPSDPMWIWSLNLNGEDSQLIFPGNSFWHTIIHMWHEFNFNEPQNKERVLLQRFTYNSKQNKPITDWNSEAVFVYQIYTENRFVESNAFNTLHVSDITWLKYSSVVSAVAKRWRFQLQSDNLLDIKESNYERLCKQQKISRTIYREFQTTPEIARNCSRKWYKKEGIVSTVDEFIKHFRNIYNITSIIKLRDFQYRLLHNKIFCNDVLFHWNVVNSNKCDFCKTQKQSIKHLLFDCEQVQKIWKKLEEALTQKGIPIEMTYENVLFNTVSVNATCKVIDFLVLVAKQYFFRNKCLGDNITWFELRNLWYTHYKMDIYNSGYTSSKQKIRNKWKPVYEIIS